MFVAEVGNTLFHHNSAIQYSPKQPVRPSRLSFSSMFSSPVSENPRMTIRSVVMVQSGSRRCNERGVFAE